jgi:hypothetical protein
VLCRGYDLVTGGDGNLDSVNAHACVLVMTVRHQFVLGHSVLRLCGRSSRVTQCPYRAVSANTKVISCLVCGCAKPAMWQHQPDIFCGGPPLKKGMQTKQVHVEET